MFMAVGSFESHVFINRLLNEVLLNHARISVCVHSWEIATFALITKRINERPNGMDA